MIIDSGSYGEKTTLIIDGERITEYDLFDVERHAAPLILCEECPAYGDVTMMHRVDDAWLCGTCVDRLAEEHADWLWCARYA